MSKQQPLQPLHTNGVIDWRYRAGHTTSVSLHLCSWWNFQRFVVKNCFLRGIMLLIVFALLLVTPPYISGEPDKTGADGAGDRLKDFWVVRLLLNLLGYATVVLPGFLIIRHVRNTNYLDTASPGCITNILRLCVTDQEAEKPSLEEGGAAAAAQTPGAPWMQSAVKLVFCATGLLLTYLTWGLLQERIMAIEYGAVEGIPGERFKNSQFLVFMNRILAFVAGVTVLLCTQQPKHTAPLYKYSYSSFSNIMSSWCQYEALKFVSFPTQVMAKASKIIPVMLMGKLVSKKQFEAYEYVTALMISAGLSMFLLTSQDAVRDKGTVTTASGIVILLGYLMFDAFTPNWQGELFKRYKMSSIQMMVGVNLFSVIFTSTTLIEQGGYTESLAFMLRHPLFMFHVVILSICSAFGQLFIFYTISQFGPVTFTIIMTTRQGLAILLSCVVFRHPITLVGSFGVLLVFSAIFVRMYISRQARLAKTKNIITPQEPTGLQKV